MEHSSTVVSVGERVDMLRDEGGGINEHRSSITESDWLQTWFTPSIMQEKRRANVAYFAQIMTSETNRMT